MPEIVKADAGCETGVFNETIQPFTSVTMHVYVPAIKLVAVWVVLPFDHKYVYGGVPPLGLAVAVPLLPPLQLISVVESVIVKAVGCDIVTEIGFPG